MPPVPINADPGDEQQDRDGDPRYHAWRYDRARKAGLTVVEAEAFAYGETTWKLLRACVDGGATVEQTRRIVL